MHIDILGRLNKTENENQYILMMVCAFSKYLITEPMKTQTSEEIMNKMLNSVIYKFGTPKFLVSDQGRQFISSSFNEFVKNLGIDHQTTTPYHQAANGQVERINKILADLLYGLGKEKSWDEKLSLATFIYNTSNQESSARTPFFVLFGREANLPIDFQIGVADELNQAIDGINELRSIEWERIRHNLIKAQEKYEFYANRNKITHEFELNDLVLIRKEVPDNKFDQYWTGPFSIVQVKKPNVTVKISDNKTKILHFNKVKKYYKYTPLQFRHNDTTCLTVDLNLEAEEI